MNGHWISRYQDDGDLEVKLKPGQSHVEVDKVAPDQLSIVIQKAADSTRMDMNPDFFQDLEVDLAEHTTVVIRGSVDTEAEVVAVIDAALSVQGVNRVIAYLKWPSHEMETERLHEAADTTKLHATPVTRR